MQPDSPDSRKLRETRDISSRAALAFGIILAVGTVASLFGMKWMFDTFMARADARQESPASLVRGEQTPLVAPEPRLQMDPIGDLRKMREEEEAVLNGYGWVDRQAGVARIPVDDAMDILLERGLPVRAGETP